MQAKDFSPFLNRGGAHPITTCIRILKNHPIQHLSNNLLLTHIFLYDA
jgi:hypothetical protein